jgi:antitoxin ParD1/3/4
MAIRQSISLADPNDAWIKSQVESGEFSNKSEVVNDLIRQARRNEQAALESIRAGLIKAESSIDQHGYSKKGPEERLADFKKKALKNGHL